MDFDQIKQGLQANPKTWLVTGAAGFIGSNLVQALLELNQKVRGLDNFATGHQANLEQIQSELSSDQWQNFEFLEADIVDLDACQKACSRVDFVLHQAALGSVPRSIEDPISSNQANISGFLNMLLASRDNGVKRFVYAASSSTYGDSKELPKREDRIGKPLSPYALTKYVNELYAEIFSKTYGIETIGLRYFNVFGRRQDPNGAYAAVIPKWVIRVLKNETCEIYGDGETSRDFCYVDNAVQANILAACSSNQEAVNQVYNVAYGERTSLNQLYQFIREGIAKVKPELGQLEAKYKDFRPGDVRHSQADISKAQTLLGYNPTHSLEQGLGVALGWYLENLGD